LGRCIVDAALEAGDQVVATARKPEQLAELVARYGDQLLPVTLDVTDADDVAKAVQLGLDAFGHYDVVVNNAGYGDIASVEDVTLEDFRAQVETNFYGVVQVTKAVLPQLRRQGSGHIFQISSLGGRIGSVGLSAYQSAKWAVGGFSTVLAQEVATFGINVTVLEPGGMTTDWAGSSMNIPPISEPYQQTVGAFAQMIREATGLIPRRSPTSSGRWPVAPTPRCASSSARMRSSTPPPPLVRWPYPTSAGTAPAFPPPPTPDCRCLREDRASRQSAQGRTNANTTEREEHHEHHHRQ
jgi:NAD(P)-dependent dehydrogenase (short-subunit alcohol dehydrogenase family)